MKRKLTAMAALLAMALVALGLGSCSLFTPDAYALMGKTFVYYSNGGHDTKTYVFDASGKAGAYVEDNQEFRWTSHTDYNVDPATKKWRSTGGAKGTFTYDPVKYDYVETPTQKFVPTVSPVAVGDGSYEKYEWVSVLNDQIRNTDSATTAYSKTIDTTKVFTVDNDENSAFALLSGSVWANVSTTTTTKTVNGKNYLEVIKVTESYDINASNINYSAKKETTSSLDGTAKDPTYLTLLNANTVNRWLGLGETPDLPDWGQSWKDGKKVTFWCDQTKSSLCEYSGTTAPAAPSLTPVDPSGIYVTGNEFTKQYYKVNTNPVASSFTFEHHGFYILKKVDSASRGL